MHFGNSRPIFSKQLQFKTQQKIGTKEVSPCIIKVIKYNNNQELKKNDEKSSKIKKRTTNDNKVRKEIELEKRKRATKK